MEVFLESVEHWTRWSALLVRFPGREQELDARAAVLVQRYQKEGGHEDPVLAAMQAAAELETALAQRTVAVPTREPEVRPERPRLPLAAPLSYAAVIVLTAILTMGGTQLLGTTRGGEYGTGMVRISGATTARDLLPERNTQPSVVAHGPVDVVWEAPANGRVFAWLATADGPRWLGPDGFAAGPVESNVVRIPEGTSGPVVLMGTVADHGQVAEMADRIRDGRTWVDGPIDPFTLVVLHVEPEPR